MRTPWLIEPSLAGKLQQVAAETLAAEKQNNP